jgi:hypothetical protein
MIRFTDTTTRYIVKMAGSDIRWVFADAELARSNASSYSANTGQDIYVYEQDEPFAGLMMIDAYRTGSSLFA